MLKNRQFNTLIVEGPDTEFKQQFMQQVHDYFKGQYLVMTHGDIYEQVYALKNGITPVRHTHGAQVLYVLFYFIEDENNEQQKKELKLYENVDRQLLVDEYKTMRVVRKDTLKETVCEFCQRFFFKHLLHTDESEYNNFNKMYSEGCKKYDLRWNVVDNQPYLYNRQIMADYQYHNGSYETYDDKSIPDTLLYSAAYTNTKSCKLEDFLKKKYDVQYPINSKIKYREDAKDYIKKTIKSLTLYTSKSQYIDEVVSDYSDNERKNVYTFDKVFCDDYIVELSKAKTTIITNREFAHTEMMTARWYEAVLANCIIFVDEKTDPNNKVLKQIYGKNSKYIQLLTVTPETFVEKVNNVFNNTQDIEEMLNAQHAWYNKLLNEIDSTEISYLCR